MTKLAVISILASLVVGCAAMKDLLTDSPLLVQIAVGEVLYQHPDWSGKANTIANDILDKEFKDIGRLEYEARSSIMKLDVSPATKILANQTITAIKTGLVAEFDKLGLDREERLRRTISFIEWVAEVTGGREQTHKIPERL